MNAGGGDELKPFSEPERDASDPQRIGQSHTCTAPPRRRS